MKSGRMLGWAIVVGLCVAGGVAWRHFWPDLPAPTSPVGGRIELAAGLVEQRRGEGFEPVASGMPLGEAAALRTGPGARALLRLVGGASAFADQGTSLSLKGAGLSLEKGRVWLDVPASPEAVLHHLGDVGLSAADAGVSLSRHEKEVEIYVARGLAVITASGGRREVAAGERATVDASGVLSVSAVAFWDDWTGGMADHGVSGGAGSPGAGQLYAVDRGASAGTKSLPLEVKRQAVRARLADGIAETEVDQTFFNPSDRPVEGWYWFTVPASAIVTGFALETRGVLIEGEVVERKEAAAKYEAAVQNAYDPALLEWIDGRSYRARVFPVPALGTRRVVLRYLEVASAAGGTLRYLYPMAQTGPTAAAIGEFSLSVTLDAKEKSLRVSTLPDARVEDDGHRVTMRRSVYTPRADFQLEALPKEAPEPLRVSRFAAGGDQADFVMIRYVPDVDWTTVKTGPAEVVVAVDTSASGDEADHQLKARVAEAILRSLSADDKFALMTADVAPHVLFPEAPAAGGAAVPAGSGLAAASPENVARAIERLAERSGGGATDLGSIFDPGLRRLHGAEQPALIYIGDGVPTSGEIRGLEVVERLRRALEGSRARFFTVGVGGGAQHALLERLASVGGGASFRVDGEEEAVSQALRLSSAVKTPTLTEFTLDVGVGLDEPLSNVTGKIPRGQEMILLARTHHDLPATAKIHGRVGGKPFDREHSLSVTTSAATPIVPLLWAAEFVQRLLGNAESPEDARGKIVSLGLDYGLMTPFSSILALESEHAYGKMGIERRRRAWNRLALNDRVDEPGTAAQVASVVLAPLGLLTGCTEASRDQAPARGSAAASAGGKGEEKVQDLFKSLEQETAPAATAPRNDEGQMGKRDSDSKNQRWAIKGPSGIVDPASADGLDTSSASDPRRAGAAAPSAAPHAAGGEMLGSESGEAAGFGGLGIAGAGRGGGGLSESSIGIGHAGTMGTGYGYGRRSGAANPELRMAAGQLSVNGSLDGAVIRRVIRQHQPEMRYCYEKQLRVSPGLAGRLTLALTIGANGAVTTARAESSTLGETAVGSCVTGYAKRWVFPEPRGGGVVVVRYPFVFECVGEACQPAIAPPTRLVVARPAPVPVFPCSDASARPLAQRMILWSRRLKTAEGSADAVAQYDGALGHCELPGWHDRRAFLGLIDRSVRSAEAAERVMQRFEGEPEALAYLGRRILRRNLDPYVAAAVERYLKGGQIEWSATDLELAELPDDKARIARLQELLRATPGDAAGEMRLVKWLDRAGQRAEALALARKLRERGLLSPAMTRRYGDLMAAMGQPEDALRAYSEIVEFDADSPGAHRMVGDILLGHGWYEAAYREYRTLTEMASTDAAGGIRLALSAAGAGRTDEALRLLRSVAEGDGKPGPDDPRIHARMLSGALIARLIAEGKQDAAGAEALVRRLKQLQLMSGPGRLVILTWETLDASLGMADASADVVDARDVGLFAFRGSSGAFETLKEAINVRSERPEGVTGQEPEIPYTLHEIVWDGKTFAVKVVPGAVPG